jgi:glycosyltransferase involved in cell wall biosynthesis
MLNLPVKDLPATTQKNLRVAWLLHIAAAYLQPIVSEFSQLIQPNKVYTGKWPGFLPGFEGTFEVEQVGEAKVVGIPSQTSYGPSVTFLSPSIVGHLLKYRPQVVFTIGFTLWTIFALLLKPIGGWRVIIMNDGSSPGVDQQGSPWRISLRKWMTRFTDAFVTTSQSGKTYLTEVLGAPTDAVFARPYLVPHPKTYIQPEGEVILAGVDVKHPIFICVGFLIPRKGLQELLQSCLLLQRQGFQDYTVLLVGNGEQEAELKAFVQQHQLEQQVKLVGFVEYDQLAPYYQKADVFVFPTREDVWGMVAVEAMMFGKPILCSKWAGVCELVFDGENGYVFNPYEPEQLASLMRQFIEQPELIGRMGQKSKQVMADHTPEAVARSFAEVVTYVLDR